jgi:hypothetical protein
MGSWLVVDSACLPMDGAVIVIATLRPLAYIYFRPVNATEYGRWRVDELANLQNHINLPRTSPSSKPSLMLLGYLVGELGNILRTSGLGYSGKPFLIRSCAAEDIQKRAVQTNFRMSKRLKASLPCVLTGHEPVPAWTVQEPVKWKYCTLYHVPRWVCICV